jgi:multiple sugar transport system substrate-binding protein
MQGLALQMKQPIRENLMKIKILKVFALGFLFSAPVLAGNLVINSMHSDPSVKAAFDQLLEGFKKENPDIKVTLNLTNHEDYKVQIRTWLPNKAPDIATWFAGNRAKYFVDKGLVEPIDDVWSAQASNFSSSITEVISFGGKKYLMPLSYYNWGFYYRKDLFDKVGIKSAPSTWADFMSAITKLKAASITPITIGIKDGWPAAAWFDFLNMRINGYNFHMSLLSGAVSYLDPKVKKTFEVWQSLIQAEAFNKSAAALSWQEASALMWQGKAAMYLMGNFITPQIPKDIEPNIGFFQFPTIESGVPMAEVAPVDVYFIPAKATNKAEAKKFMTYLAKATTQEVFNKAVRLIPTNRMAKVDQSDRFLKMGMETLAKAKNVSQFYDRDADPEVAKAGMDAFVEFMAKPKEIEKISKKIDAVRKRVHKG